MKATDLLADNLMTTLKVLEGFASPLTPEQLLHRPCDDANCAAWLLGHLVLTERSFMARIGVDASEMPTLPEGFDKRFARDETAPKAREYGDTSILLPLFRQHREPFAQRVRDLPQEALAQRLEQPHPMFDTVGRAIAFASTHVAVHVGQISTIRRSLGMPPLI